MKIIHLYRHGYNEPHEKWLRVGYLGYVPMTRQLLMY
jgi:hypothetical protein